MANQSRDLSGLTIGHLSTVEATPERSKRGDVIWLVRCICGKLIRMAASDFVKKPRREGQAPRSCGCIRKRTRSFKYKGFGDLSGTRWRMIKSKAKDRGLAFEITIEYAWRLFLLQQKRCALTGVSLVLSPSSVDAGASTGSLDRINNDLGYVEGNVQWVHRDINFMKHSLLEGDFIKWCTLVARYRGS